MFRSTAVSLLLLAFTLPLSAQNITVAELNKADAEKAMELYKQLQDAQKQWLNFKVSMRDKYGSELVQRLHLIDPNVAHMTTDPNQKNLILPVDWGMGIDFSSDFKFIVPAKNQ